MEKQNSSFVISDDIIRAANKALESIQASNGYDIKSFNAGFLKELLMC